VEDTLGVGVFFLVQAGQVGYQQIEDRVVELRKIS
jgi:hypothetical protein